MNYYSFKSIPPNFYNSDIIAIPDGAVEVTDEEYRALLDGREAGKVIADEPGEDGKPYLVDPPPPPPPTQEEILAANQVYQNSLISQASQAMAPILVSLQLGDATDAETVAAKAWQAYYRALKLVDITEESPTWPVAPA